MDRILTLQNHLRRFLRVIFGVLALITIGLLLSVLEQPVITLPLDSSQVYISGVYRGGSALDGEEVTHKINIEELVELLANTTMRRSLFAGRGTHRWSIYLRQSADMHIILADDISLNMGDTPTRTYRILDGGIIEAALERMIAEYEQ